MITIKLTPESVTDILFCMNITIEFSLQKDTRARLNALKEDLENELKDHIREIEIDSKL